MLPGCIALSDSLKINCFIFLDVSKSSATDCGIAAVKHTIAIMHGIVAFASRSLNAAPSTSHIRYTYLKFHFRKGKMQKVSFMDSRS